MIWEIGSISGPRHVNIQGSQATYILSKQQSRFLTGDWDDALHLLAFGLADAPAWKDFILTLTKGACDDCTATDKMSIISADAAFYL